MRRAGCDRLRGALVVALATILPWLAAAGAGAATTTTVRSPTTTAASTTTSGGSTTTSSSAPAAPSLPTTPAPVAWVVVDADSGHVLDGTKIHTPEHTASIVKITTALAALERLPPTARVTVSQNAVDHGLSNENVSGMKVGQTWSVADVVKLMMIISANDAAYAIAESTSGSLAQFGIDATATAHALGMRDSTFNDPAGLDDNTSFHGGPTMSPFDVAISVRDALHVPAIAGPASTVNYDYTDPSGVQHHVTNHNLMLPGLRYAYGDMTGFKTGSTRLAGNTFAASATRNGRTLIAVLMNCYDRYNWAKALLDRAFLTPAGAKGTGETLPAVQDLTYSHRATVQAAAVKFLTGTKGLGTGTNVPLATATSYRPVTTTVAPRRAVAAAATQSSAGSHGGAGGGVSGVDIVLIVVLALARHRGAAPPPRRPPATGTARDAAPHAGGAPARVAAGRRRAVPPGHAHGQAAAVERSRPSRPRLIERSRLWDGRPRAAATVTRRSRLLAYAPVRGCR